MPLAISDYALLSNQRCTALAGRNGSIDWLCTPAMDSPACFCALLGDERHGRWRIGSNDAHEVRRRYRPDTLILETEIVTGSGRVLLTECMPADGDCRLIRQVQGLAGVVDLEIDYTPRWDYGMQTPTLHRQDGAIVALGGGQRLTLWSDVPLEIDCGSARGRLQLRQGERRGFVLDWNSDRAMARRTADLDAVIARTEREWREWVAGCGYEGPWRDQVVRSLITLRALIYSPTGSTVAAPTTSLPECPGGPLNWDYRYCWVRDATLTVDVLLGSGFRREASEWCRQMLKAVERSGGELRTLYTVRGDRGPPEHQLGHLPGHGGARPVNVGNGAGSQLQLDTRGELMDMLLLARQHGVIEPKLWWPMQCHILESLEQNWHEPDAGIWEMRGDPRCFTHSRVMAWVAFDRSIHDAECYGLEGPLDRWRQTRDRIHAQVLGDGIDHDRNCFTQVYGGKVLDGALLRLPLVGFLPPDDPRIRATVAAIERELSNDGLVYRYRRGTDENPGPWEGAFLPCSFWLVDNWVLQDRRDEAAALFERLLSHCNDVGLLSEEIDPGNGHLLGNFPQSLTHLALVNSARMLSGKALHRGAQKAVA